MWDLLHHCSYEAVKPGTLRKPQVKGRSRRFAPWPVRTMPGDGPRCPSRRFSPVILSSPRLAPDELHRVTGWELKPEGLCRGDLCVPFRSEDPSAVDLVAAAPRLGMPLLHDDVHDVWALGPESEPGGRFLRDAHFPALTLPDVDGQDFSFSSLLGRKVVMVAWASW